MKKREAELTRKLRKHITECGMHFGSSAIEVKVTTGKSIPFSDVKEHQLQALQNAQRILAWKIADDSQGVKPFDLFVLQNANAFVAVSYLVPRKPAVVYLIPVASWIHLQQTAKRKSLTEAMIEQYPGRVLKLVLPTTRRSPAPA